MAERKREARNEIARAWNQAALNGAAFCGKLKPLSHYLQSPPQAPGEMLAVLHTLKSAGADITIRRVAA